MLRKTFIAALATLAAAQAHAFGSGDIAFTSFNADEDGWSIVALADIAAGTTIYFRDDEWNGASFSTGEGLHTWNSGAAAIAAGQVIRFSAVDKASRSVSFGTLSSTGDTGLNATSETIYAYLGVDVNTPTVFLAGVSTEGTTNLAPAGLVAGDTAVVLTNSTDYALYTGARSGAASFADYRSLVNSAANWNILVGGDQAAQVPDLTAFTVTPVPEPGSYALMLAGLGLIGAMVRRRIGG